MKAIHWRNISAATLLALAQGACGVPLEESMYDPDCEATGECEPTPESEAALNASTDLFEIGYHPSGLSYWSGSLYFSNAMANASGWEEKQADGSWVAKSILSSQFNSRGYPKQLDPTKPLKARCLGLGRYHAPEGWPDRSVLLRGKVVLTWKGDADIRVLGAQSQVAGSTSGNELNGRREYLFGPGNNDLFVQIYSVASEITEIRVWLPDPTDPQNRALENKTFHPYFLARLADADWKYIRFMDWNQTNASPVQDWLDRRIPDHAFQTGVLNPRNPAPGVVMYTTSTGQPVYAEGNRHTGVALEHMVALSNATGKDMWITVPHLATDDFIDRMARTIAFGSDGVNPYSSGPSNAAFKGLNAGRKVFVEFSNEIWSSGPNFAQGNWAEAKGREIGITKAQYNARMFSRAWQRFETVLGTRVVRVAAVFTGSTDYTRQFLDELYNNTTLLKPHVMAVTTYFGHGIQNWINAQGWTANKLWTDAYWTSTQFETDMNKAFDQWEKYALTSTSYGGPTGYDAIALKGGIGDGIRNLAKQRGLPMIAYEGGPSLYTDKIDGGSDTDDGITNFMVAMNRKPRFARIYEIILEQSREMGLYAGMAFVDVSSWGKYGQWGHLEYSGQPPAESVKWSLLTRWSQEHKAIRNVDTPTGAVPSFTTAAVLPVAQLGKSYWRRLAASGGDGTLTYKTIHAVMPPGLTYNESTRTISGTPTTANMDGYVYLRVTDADGDPAWRLFSVKSVQPLTTPKVIDMEEFSTLGSPQSSNPINSKGYLLKGGNTSTNMTVCSTAEGYASKVLHVATWGDSIEIKAANGKPFKFISLKHANGRWGGSTSTFKVIGYSGGQTFESAETLAPDRTSRTLTLNWEIVDRVVIRWTKQFGAIDDIQVATYDGP